MKTYRAVYEFDMAGWTYRPDETFSEMDLAARNVAESELQWALRRGFLEEAAAAPAPYAPAPSPAPEPDEG
jgi:hypothetical protein